MQTTKDDRPEPVGARPEHVEGRASIARHIEELGVVAVIRLKDPAKLRAVVDALADGGVRALEVTMTVPRAVEMIRELAPTIPEGFLLGAGTVTDVETARAVIDAGATFVVGPVFRPDVIAACHERGVPAVPGCFSPTEILAAHEAGADIVKLFPATMLGPQYIKDVRAPMPQLKLMPTGGVTLDNAGDWIRAGAVAVGVGSALVEGKAIEQGRFEVITANAQKVVASVSAARSQKSG
jgi:2-dehydro-3-deoxyphosphogluconate aldolase/(4S)-4-hydroxy-2-oxoglutarate aldolase